MRRLTLLFSFLVGCSGSGATVSDSSSELSEERPPSVQPAEPATPVAPITLTKFECKTSKPLADGAIHLIRFSLRGEALEPLVEIEPQPSVLEPLVKASLERSAGKLTLATDERTELVLFENSDFTRGYVKADGGDYAEVYCTKSR